MTRPTRFGALSVLSALAIALVLTRATAQAPRPPRADKLKPPADWNGSWWLAETQQDGVLTKLDPEKGVPTSWKFSDGTFESSAGVPFAFSNTETGSVRIVGIDDRVYQVEKKWRWERGSLTRDGVKTTVEEGAGKELWELADKDTLRVCTGPDPDKFPADFTTKKGDGKRVVTFKRVNPEPPEAKRAAPAVKPSPGNPPAVLLATDIDKDGKLVLVSYRTVIIGIMSIGPQSFAEMSENRRSLTPVSLKEVKIFGGDGKEVSVEAARKRLGGKETAVLVSSWGEGLPAAYKPLFKDDVLVFVFPEKAPVWEAIRVPADRVRR